MDSKNDRICKIITFLTLLVYLRSATANNIDCEGKPFHCVNSTHFMICVDFGAGVSKTVDNFVIQCPAMTECSRNNHFECEYRLPTTTETNIRPDDGTTDLTIDTQINTISSNDITNTISPIAKTSITGFLDEYINTIDVTTNVNYLSDVQIYKQNEILEKREMVTYDKQLSVYNQSKFMASTSKTNAIKNVDFLEINNKNSSEYNKLIIPSKATNLYDTLYNSTQPEEVSSERSFVSNIADGIENVTNVSIDTDTKNDIFLLKLLDTLHYTTSQNGFKNASKLMNQEVNTFRKMSTQATEMKNIDVVTDFLQNFTTQTPPLTLYPKVLDNLYFKNTTSKIENIKTKFNLNQVGVRLQELLVEKSYTSLKPTQIKNLGAPKENISEISFFGDTDTSISTGNSTTIENKIELSTEFDLIGQLAQEKAIRTSTYDLNISDVTENYNLVPMSFTLKPIMTPTEYMVETKQTIVTATEANDNFKRNGTYSEGRFLPTTLNSITLENKVFNNVTSKSAIKETKLKLSDYIFPSNNLTTASETNFTGKKLQEIVTESILTSTYGHYVKTASLDVPFEVTSSVTTNNLDHTISSTMKQIPYDNTSSKTSLREEHVLEVPVLSNISTIKGKVLNLPTNITNNLMNVNLTTSTELTTTLDSTSESVGLATRLKGALRTTTMSSNDFNEEIILQKETASKLPADVGTTSSVLNLLQSDDYVPNAKNITQLELTTPILNLNNTTFYLDHSKKITVIENSRTFLSTTELSPQEEDETQITSLVTGNPYTHGFSVGVENKTLISDLNLKDQMIRDTNLNTSSAHEFFPINITITNTESPHLPAKFLSKKFTDISSVTTFKQAALDQVTSRKEMIESTTLLYTNENGKLLLQNTIATEISPEEAVDLLNFTQQEYHGLDKEHIVINETPPPLNHEESKLKSSIQTIMERIMYDKNTEKIKLFTNLAKNNNYNEETLMTTPENYSTLNAGKIASNSNINESISIIPESMMTATFNNFSDLYITQNPLFKDAQLPENSFNVNTTLWLQKRLNNESSWSSTKNPKTSKNDTLAQNIIQIDLPRNHANLDEVTIVENKNSTIEYNDDTRFGMLQYQKGNEMVKAIEKMIWENKSYNTTNEIYDTDQVPAALRTESIDINTVATEVTIQNQQTLNNTSRLTSQDQIIQSTEKSQWDVYNFTNTGVFVTNQVIIPPTPASSLMTLLSTADDILSKYNQIATQSSNSLSTGISNMLKNTENNKDKNDFLQIPDNMNQNNQDPGQTDYIDDKIMSPVTTKNIVITNVANTINVSLFEDPGEYGFFLNKSFPILKHMKLNQDIEIDRSPVQKFNVTEVPSSIIENMSTTFSVTQNIIPTNITNNFTNNSSYIQSMDYYYNSNSRKGHLTNISDTVTITPTSNSNIILFHTINSENTSNHFHSKINQLNASNEDRISNKRPVLVNAGTLLHNLSLIDKTKIIYKERPTSDKILFTAKLALNATTASTSHSDIYVETGREYNILDEHNFSTIVNNKSHSTPNRPIGDLDSDIIESHLPVIPALQENVNKDSLNGTLAQTLKNYGPYFRSTRGSKVEASNYTKKTEVSPSTSTITSFLNKIIIATTNSESRTIPNVSMKVNQSSTKYNVSFRCNNRSRGRFADKSNCRKYYICFGKNHLIAGECPNNTVFSEIKKQCTKNLSHCIRNNQFRCIKEGRFSDVLRKNIYYICVNKKNSYVRFQYKCQNGFQLNKTSVTCVKHTEFKSLMTSVSKDNDSNKGSNQSPAEHISKEKKLPNGHLKYDCKAEGKFPDKEDCRKYYVCSKNSKSVFRRRTKKCDSDEIFHREKKKCVDRNSYECN